MSAAEVRQPTPSIGEYRLLTELASGGMATVYVGAKRRAAGFERLVAIKVCHQHLAKDPEFLGMFLDEARLAARIRHPNVVGTIDVDDAGAYLVMEYVEGSSFGALVKRADRAQKKLPVPVTLRIVRDFLSGLHAAHELQGPDGKLLGVVHRDVSPQNVLVGTDGITRITDFGIAFAETRSSHTEDGQVKGKTSYLAPETLIGARVHRRMDVFSAGIVLWEALTARPLFRRENNGETLVAIMQDEAAPPSKYNPGVPPELDAVVLKALAKDPVARFQTAAAFHDALTAFAAAEPREVGALVREHFGGDLSARRDKIRDEPGTPVAFTPASGNAPAHVDPAPSIPPGELHQKRLRGVVLGVTLMLVGAALALLLSRGEAPRTPEVIHGTK